MSIFNLIMFVILLVGAIPMSFAENLLTCPSIDSVHNLRNIWPNGPWLPLYISNEELASMEDIYEFSKNATELHHAEWYGKYLEAGHCFYSGSNKIILAFDMLEPDAARYPLWRVDQQKRYSCVSKNENDCTYSGIGLKKYASAKK